MKAPEVLLPEVDAFCQVGDAVASSRSWSLRVSSVLLVQVGVAAMIWTQRQAFSVSLLVSLGTVMFPFLPWLLC